MKKQLLCTTALVGFAFLMANPANAACDNNAPITGDPLITCSGSDAVGVQGPAADNISVDLQAGADITNNGPAIELGANANLGIQGTITTSVDSGIIVGNGADILVSVGGIITAADYGIEIGGGDILIQGTVNGNTNGILGTGGAVTAEVSGNLIGGATFGGGNDVFILHDSGTITGTVDGAAGADEFRYINTGSDSFDSDEIGTKYLGFDSLFKDGTGTLTLTGTTTGNWTITDGTLIGTVGNLNNVDIGASTTLRLTTGGTLAGDLTGAGDFEKIGGAALTLEGNNTFSGELLVDSATLAVEDAAAFSGVSQVSLNAATFQYNSAFTTDRNFDMGAGNGTMNTQAFNITVSGDISGVGILAKSGAGTLTLTGSNSYAGLNVGAGQVTGDSDSLVGAITNNGIVEFSQAGVGTYAGDMSGTGSLLKTGAGNLTMSGTNTYSGGTTISAGTLTGDTDSLQGAITNNATLVFDQAGNATFVGTISGTGSVTKTGAGTLTLNTAQTYSGLTQITGGTLAVNDADRLGDGSGTNALSMNNGTLQYDASFDTARDITLDAGGGTFNTNGFSSALGGIIDGAGDLTKNGIGRLTLSGVNTYLGDTIINGGQLRADTSASLGDAGNEITMNGGEFEYGSSFDHARDVNILAGGGEFDMGGFNSIVSGALAGAGDLYISGGGVLTLSNDNSTFTGDLTIDGSTVFVNAANQLGGGTQINFDGGGVLEGNGAFNLTQNIAFVGNGTIDSVFNHTFSGDVTGNGDIRKDGTGILSLTGDLSAYTGNADVNAGTLFVSNDFQGDADIGAGSVFEIGDNTNGTYAGQLSGGGDFAKTGTGDLELTGDNSGFNGTVSVVNSTLAISNSNNLGDASGTNTLTLTDATLDYQNSFFDNTRDVTLGGASVTFNNTNAMTMSGDIGGTADFVKTGGARLLLTGTNTYIGNLLINEGAVRISADTGLGNAANEILIDQAIFEYGASFDHARDITISHADSRIDTRGFNSTLSGDIDGAGRLNKEGAGILTLTGTNTYSGGVHVTGGTLIGDTGSIIGDVENDASVVFDQAGNDTISNDLSGTGDFTFDGGASYSLTGTNTYAGGTTVTAGSEIVGDTAAVQGDIVNDGDVTFIGTNGTYAGDISGTGALNVNMMTTNDALTITSAGHSYSGGTHIIRGYLIGDTDSLQGDIINDDKLTFDQAFNGAYTGDISGTGAIIKDGTGEVTLSGTNTYAGGITITAGTLIGDTGSLIGDVANSGTLVFDQAANDTFADNVTGTGDFVKDGIGNLTLSGTNTFTDLYVDDGTLTGTIASLGGASVVNVFNTGALVLDQAGAGTYGADISGTGDVTFDGGGDYLLTGTNTYSGGTTITATTTVTGNAAALQGDIANAGDVVFDQTGTATYAGEMSGAGNLEKTGAGQLNLTTDSLGFTGDTTISDGRLHFNADWRNTEVTVDNGGLLGGNGFIGDTIVNNGGIFAPGNSIDTINVIGNLTFNAGSILQIEFTATPDDSDKIIATGDVTINGGSVLAIASGGTYLPNTQYTIITGNTITGTFDDVDTDMAFLDAQLFYDLTDVTLNITRNDTDFRAVAEDAGQRGVADALTDLGTGNDLFDAFTSLSADDAREALNDLSGEQIAGTMTANIANANALRSTISSHLTGLMHANNEDMVVSALAPVTDPGTYIAAMLEPAAGELPNWDNKRVWLQMMGGFGRSDARRMTPEQDRHSYGAIAGLDIPMDKGGWYGFFGGYEVSDVETNSQSASADVDNYHVGAYATIPLDKGFNISGGINATYHAITTQRYVEFPGFSEAPQGDTDGATVAAYAEISKPLKMLDAAVEPFVALSVTHSRIKAYDEEQGGTANLSVEEADTTNPATTIGVRLARMVYMEGIALKLNATLGWQHVFGDVNSKTSMRFVTGGTDFTAYGTPQERDSILFGIGIDGKLSERANGYVAYNGTYSSESEDHAVKAGVKVKF